MHFLGKAKWWVKLIIGILSIKTLAIVIVLSLFFLDPFPALAIISLFTAALVLSPYFIDHVLEARKKK